MTYPARALENCTSESYSSNASSPPVPSSSLLLPVSRANPSAVSDVVSRSVPSVVGRSPLLDSTAISSHLQAPKPALEHAAKKISSAGSYELDSYFNNEELCKSNPLIRELYNRGFPIAAINSMLRCGQATGSMIKECCCGRELITLSHRCNMRTCPVCSQTRKRRIRKKVLPYLQSLRLLPGYEFLFLTISPRNYESFGGGYKHLLKSFSKFRRNKYVQDRVKGGFFVPEAKTINPNGEFMGWNIHLHAIILSRRLDNRIRGRCNKCGQNLLKYDQSKQMYFCANSKCNSYDVSSKGDSRLVKIWKKCSKREATIDVRPLLGVERALNYALKYISSDKSDFSSVSHLAQYIIGTRKRKLFIAFGSLFRFKPIKMPCLCRRCNQPISFIFNLEGFYPAEAGKPPGFLLTSPQ